MIQLTSRSTMPPARVWMGNKEGEQWHIEHVDGRTKRQIREALTLGSRVREPGRYYPDPRVAQLEMVKELVFADAEIDADPMPAPPPGAIE